AKRRICECPVDLGLAHNRLVRFRPATRGQEVKLMAVTAGAGTGAGVARVDPERQSVRASQPSRISLRELILALYLCLHGQAKFVPGETDIRKILPLVGLDKVVDPARFRQLQETIRVV